MNIQWYPGHMAKAKKKIKEELGLVDIVFELVDARAPASSENPDIEKLCLGKKRLILLNKADLADEDVTKRWLDHYRARGERCIALDGRKREAIARVKREAGLLLSEKRKRDLMRGIAGERPLRALVAGIPNVGKSSFINSMRGKAAAKTGNKPGVTKGTQWINVSDQILLLDTPGVLWPRFDDEKAAERLAIIGSLSDDILNIEELSLILIDFLLEHYRTQLFERYGIDEGAFSEALNGTEESEMPGFRKEALTVLDLISRSRGALKKGGIPDYERSSRILIDDFRGGRIGRISLEEAET